MQKSNLNNNNNVFMGCVGQDECAEIIRDEASKDGLVTLFQTTDRAHTAKCAVLLTDKNRSLVCHLGAAKLFSIDSLERCWPIVESSKLFYLTVCI